MIQDSLLEVAIGLLLLLAAAGAVLAALYVVVRTAVEHGIRRALPDAALRQRIS